MEEALAMRCALRMAQNAGWTKIEVQSDCKVVVDQILAGNGQEGILATILEDIDQLKNSFKLCKFSFVHRKGNQCNHLLARFAVKLVENVKWDNQFLMWLTNRAEKDLRVVTPFCI